MSDLHHPIGKSLRAIRTGQTGLGKSTLINTIFASHLMDSKGRLSPTEHIRSTTEIQSVSHGLCKAIDHNVQHLTFYQSSKKMG